MIRVEKLEVEYSSSYVVTDNSYPIFTFSYSSDRNNTEIKEAYLELNNHKIDVLNKSFYKYEFDDLKPLTSYKVKVFVKDDQDNFNTKEVEFETGLMKIPFSGKWISDGEYLFKEKKISPKTLLFLKNVKFNKKVVSAKIYSTAIGIYKIKVNGNYVGEDYFAPGFTSYKHQLQYQVYDVLSSLKEENEIRVYVAGGWAVGSYVITRVNRITSTRQALKLELRIKYEDGNEDIIPTDTSWKVSHNTEFKEADLYDGEVFDARFDEKDYGFHNAIIENVNINPTIRATYGSLVKEHEVLKPEYLHEINGKHIFDFKQNFAGIVKITLKNCDGNEKIIVKHAEILTKDKDLNTAFLRTAKARFIYYPHKGDQVYKPTFTYMGFRYISIEGISLDKVEIEAVALYSDIKKIGDFTCSDPLINRLQQNITWSLRSNFVEIPTDCPQRDERMGWTGDINVFAPTAVFNYDITKFLDKWLIDMKSEQLKSGGIPNTIPSQGYGFPTTMPTVACEFWGDAIINVPYELYRVTGNTGFLSFYYHSMKNYVKACLWRANFLSFGKKKYIWKSISMIHFGDWVAPDIDKMSVWQGRHPFTATASLKASASRLSEIAKILKIKEDEEYYKDLANKVSDAYESILLDDNAKLVKEEFQTGYVLPIYFDMLNSKKEKALDNLVNLIKSVDYKVMTGFPGTPYILFALLDNGKKEEAFNMLFNTECPSWLYEVKVGGTTIWERWNGLDENGECNIKEDGTGGMISYNHYASGAIGNFLYSRVAGISSLTPGYESFEVKPVLTDKLNMVEAYTHSAFGKIYIKYEIKDGEFSIKVEVPLMSKCRLVLPSGDIKELSNGKYEFSEKLK